MDGLTDEEAKVVLADLFSSSEEHPEPVDAVIKGRSDSKVKMVFARPGEACLFLFRVHLSFYFGFSSNILQ